MPIVEVTYYQAVCDGCGTNMTESAGSDFSAWSDAGIALDEVGDGWGWTDGENLIACPGCLGAYMVTLGDVEEDRVDRREFWAVAAFRGWLKRRLSASGDESA